MIEALRWPRGKIPGCSLLRGHKSYQTDTRRLWAKQQSYTFCVDLLEVRGPSAAANPELALPTIACQGKSKCIGFTVSGGVRRIDQPRSTL